MLCCQELPSGEGLRLIGRIFRLLPIPLPFDALDEGISSSYRVHIWYGKIRMAGLQSGEGSMMINSVVWAQYTNVTDTHTDRHVATAKAAPTHSVGRLKLTDTFFPTVNRNA